MNLIINDVDSDTKGVYDIIKQELGDLSLMIRPTFNMVGQTLIDPSNAKKVGPEQLLVNQLKVYGNSDVDALAIDLYRLLSKNKSDEANELINQFYNEHYANVVEEVEFKTEEIIKEKPSKKQEVQATFKEDVE